MRLLTLNCHSWLEEDQMKKLQIIANDIIEKQYDVIALQEVNQSIGAKLIGANVREDNFALVLINKVNELSKEKYTLYYEKCHIGFEKYEEGVAIITRHKVVNVESFLVSKVDDFYFWKTRKVIKASVLIDGKEIDFYSCHLGWWDDKEEPFKAQFDKLYNLIDKEKLTFLMGDFNNNAFVRQEGYDYILSKGLFDTYNLAKFKDDGVTVKTSNLDGWNESNNKLRIDFIFVNKCIEVTSSFVIFNGINKEVVSDHFGVSVFQKYEDVL
ncbi:endonuclease/exonuclease/phosphatase family protein [Thermosipho atlanticus]|uniref:Maltose 6'-phosphate phosphatase n=1 Tax=Thermosipho atlanticus DSM 15807 TaxID=1123380 RepID=A0A1M5T7Q2_9BACT|nr:endonuclease/exonuclease/phosphatase family protein [Thermosipho atlanticus]SHH46744.1 maltose 6'-phosphate phosphatase [Thermosipho atlanticus DSM 15807]